MIRESHAESGSRQTASSNSQSARLAEARESWSPLGRAYLQFRLANAEALEKSAAASNWVRGLHGIALGGPRLSGVRRDPLEVHPPTNEFGSDRRSGLLSRNGLN
jgi:hypothetical protein